MAEETPPFPQVAGHEKISESDKTSIAEAAWRQASGSVRAFGQLVAEHVRGEINLLGENPSQIRVRGTSPAPGSDQYTATGGEVGDTPSAGPAPGTATPAVGAAVAGAGAPAGTVTGVGTATGQDAGELANPPHVGSAEPVPETPVGEDGGAPRE